MKIHYSSLKSNLFKTLFCKETNLRQKQSIEVNQKDLITLLHLIEDESKDKPQLIIKSLSLKKTDKNTYSCKMDLLKREFN